jgi:hypothetical protein
MLCGDAKANSHAKEMQRGKPTERRRTEKQASTTVQFSFSRALPLERGCGKSAARRAGRKIKRRQWDPAI